MSFTKVLCPTDFSAGANHAMRMAAQIAASANVELVLAHVWYTPAFAFSNELVLAPDLIQEMADQAQQGLDAAVREASELLGRPVAGRMLRGVPWAELVWLLEDQRFDLCVIGTHGRTGLSRVLLGSVTEKVVRRAPCSVLAVRPNADVKPFRHVLVPTDFSTSAAHALDLATSLVGPDGRITLLHVLELNLRYPGGVVDIDLDKRAASELDQAAAHLTSKARTATVLRTGWPGAQILELLDEDRSIDLVAMGSHGLTGIKRMLLGSVAEKTIRYARCPVLVARQPTEVLS